MFKVSTSGSMFCGGASHVQRCLSAWAPRALGLEPPCPGGRSVGTRSRSPAFPTLSGVGLHCFLVEFSLSAISTSSTSASMPCHSFTKVKKHIPKYRREKQPCSLGAQGYNSAFLPDMMESCVASSVPETVPGRNVCGRSCLNQPVNS